jgi:hypothetical protein
MRTILADGWPSLSQQGIDACHTLVDSGGILIEKTGGFQTAITSPGPAFYLQRLRGRFCRRETATSERSGASDRQEEVRADA